MANNSDYNRAFDHITRVWLQTETSEIGLLLREGEVGNLRRLKTYLRHPGLLEGRYTNDDGDQVELDDEQKEEIAGVSSYMNYLQNHWGPEYTISPSKEDQTLKCSLLTTVRTNLPSN